MANNTVETGKDSHLAHHFHDSEQQFEASKLGMWVFLVTEILFFGGLFVAYIVFRSWHPDLFEQAAMTLDTTLGALNTVVLIASSLTIVLAVRAAQVDKQRQILIMIGTTILLAIVFMVVKYFEYASKFESGMLPAGMYFYDGIDHELAPVFYSIYYMLTGLHGIHVLVGIGLMGWLFVRAYNGAYHSGYFTQLEVVALYWHLVDIIWIFLFPLLYLIE